MPSWLNDFEFKRGHVYIKATDTRLSMDRGLISEVLHWFPFFIIEQTKGFARLFLRRKRPKFAYLPTAPRPWYLLRVTANRAGAITTRNLEEADAVFYFEDQTNAVPPAFAPSVVSKAYNFDCYDISKTRVGRVFHKVFGYPLTIDPETYDGMIAVKSEKNGAHDGGVIQGPVPSPDPKLVYQRLINNQIDADYVEDLRCPIIGGEIRIVFIKRRPLSDRFANSNAKVSLADPDDLFCASERAKLKAFAAAMGLDWGGMDVLRDKDSGKIYVVDVNKTDMGPPIALSLRDKNKATTILTQQLLELVGFDRG